MPRLRASVITVLAGCLCTATACSLLTSLDGLSDGPVPGGSESGTESGGAESGPADATGATDASVDSADAGEAGSSRYATEVLADKPLLYYRFGEAEGSPAKDEVSGKTVPYSVQGITLGAPGALVGDPNTAIALDGTGLIKLTHKTEFAGKAPFSVEVWISRSSADTFVGFVIDHEDWSENRRGWLLTGGTEGFGFERWDTIDGGTLNNSTGAGGTLVAGEIHHVVSTFDGTTMRVYVDSVRGGTYTVSLDLPPSGESFSVGKQNCTPCAGTGFVGVLDELAIYDHALTETRILAHFNAGKGL